MAVDEEDVKRLFDQKMKMIAEKAINPETKFMMMVGPEGAEWLMGVMYSMYRCGINDVKIGRI